MFPESALVQADSIATEKSGLGFCPASRSASALRLLRARGRTQSSSSMLPGKKESSLFSNFRKFRSQQSEQPEAGSSRGSFAVRDAGVPRSQRFSRFVSSRGQSVSNQDGRSRPFNLSREARGLRRGNSVQSGSRAMVRGAQGYGVRRQVGAYAGRISRLQGRRTF